MIPFNTQTLLFDVSKKARKSEEKTHISSDFYEKGFAVVEGITTPHEAQELLEAYIASIDTDKLSIYKSSIDDMQLAKADIIPICEDSVETSFQALHFDMGQPIMSEDPQNMYTLIGLYFPSNTQAGTAKTRVLSLKGLFADERWGTIEQLEQKLISYVQKYGDGWDDVNTHRLQCFARLVDAAYGTSDLKDYRDKTMAQWFKDEHIVDGVQSMRNEIAFLEAHGLGDITNKEVDIMLLPGQLLIIDNMRAVHGRIGKRNAQEIYQFMYGVKDASPRAIESFRAHLVQQLKGAFQ